MLPLKRDYFTYLWEISRFFVLVKCSRIHLNYYDGWIQTLYLLKLKLCKIITHNLNYLMLKLLSVCSFIKDWIKSMIIFHVMNWNDSVHHCHKQNSFIHIQATFITKLLHIKLLQKEFVLLLICQVSVRALILIITSFDVQTCYLSNQTDANGKEWYYMTFIQAN